MKHFTYIRPEEPLPGPETIEALSGKSLVIVDGVGEALSLHGLKNDEEGFLTFNGKLLRPLSLTGAAVVSIDQLPKNKNNQDAPIGTVYKMYVVSGASYILRKAEPFGLGKTGFSRLEVRKDRPGHIGKESVDGGIVAELHMISDDPEIATVVKLRTPVSLETAKSKSRRAKIRSYMLAEGKPLSKDAIAKGAGGHKSETLAEIESMISDGTLVEVTEGRWTRYTYKDPF